MSSVAASVPHSSTFCSGNRREVTTAEQPPLSVRSDGKAIEIRPRSNTAAGVLKHMGRKRSQDVKRSRKASLVYPSFLYESFVSGARESFVSANSLGEKAVWSDGQSELDEGSLQYIDETEEVDETDEGIGSLGCIFSLWNTMVGSTIIVLPYGFHEAGPIVGSLIAALAAGCSLFTAVGCHVGCCVLTHTRRRALTRQGAVAANDCQHWHWLPRLRCYMRREVGTMGEAPRYHSVSGGLLRRTDRLSNYDD